MGIQIAKRPLFTLLVAALAGCGSSASMGGGTSSPTGTGDGTMSVTLVDATGPYAAINLEVQEVDIHGTSGWITLSKPMKIVDLLSLTGGMVETLASGVSLPAGTYTQLRLVLGPNNTVVPTGGTAQPLTVPSGQQSGVKLNATFTVAAGTTKDVFIDFDASRSIFVHRTGASAKYILRPVIFAVDKLLTGSVSGKLTDSATEAGLPGVTVTAETVDASGAPAVVRSATTAADGTYTIDLLPIGGTYYVVAMPALPEGPFYPARSSGPLALTDASPTATYSAAFTATTQLGGVGGGITPVATTDQSDLVLLEQSLDVGGGSSRSFIVGTDAAAVVNGAERYTFQDLPAGGYALAVTRSTVDSQGNETVATSTPTAVAVAAGGTAKQDLVAP
jgi:hypothetical protein